MCKMVQLSHWALQFILLCQLWQLGAISAGWPEHSRMGIYQKAELIPKEDIGDIVLFIIIVIVGEIGKKLDKGYICPVYCEVDHKHRIPDYDTEREQGIDKEADPPQDGSVNIADRQQPESSIRPLSNAD